MGSFLRRHRELFAVVLLLALPFLVYSSHAGVEEVPGAVRRAVVWVTTPVQRVVVGTVSGLQDLWYGYVDLRDIRARNLELMAKTQRMGTLENQLAELQSENDRLRRLAAYAESRPDTRMISAPVLGWGPDPKFKGIRIGRGEADGLLPGMPVVTPDGLVGRIVQVYGQAADVLLVSDPSSAVAAMTQRTRARASAAGTGDARHLRLDYLGRNEDVEEGDILVTSNAGGLFPRGLRLGRATGVRESGYGLFKTASLEPAVDFSRLEEVQVMMDAGPTAAVVTPGLPIVR